jgi:hypothetical protein
MNKLDFTKKKHINGWLRKEKKTSQKGDVDENVM